MYSITKASIEDIDRLVTLINSAYRGESSRQGWTTEADLLDGIRIDKDQLRVILNKEDSSIYIYSEDEKILACVLLEKQDKILYLGLLTVSPGLQGKGIGKILLTEAEEEAKRKACTEIQMTVISVRDELIDWYKRHGYIDTGIKKPFPKEAEKFGRPKRALEFIVMKKLIQ